MTRTGVVLGERYRLDRRIAAGGVGQVWQAADLLLGRPVAVKVLRPEYADHPETLERFRKEARHAGAISHPHVAQVYDYGPAGPGWPPYLVLEFVDGPSLADLLVVDPVEAGFALDVVAQAADGLSAAHRAGLVHRDVKPGNLLIGPEGQVKVTDFGIAYAAGQAPVTGPNLVMGTTQYMAPERIAGGSGTPASDLYALGIVLHECLTGLPPFEGAPSDVMAAHLYLPLPPLPDGVPPELDALVARLTVKDPALRMSDARELSVLAAGLRDALAAGRLVPSARAAAMSRAGSLAADAADAGTSLSDAGRAGTALADARRADAAVDASRALEAGFGQPGTGDPAQAASGRQPAEDGNAAEGGDRAVAGRPADGADPPPGDAPVSDEWAVPARMSEPASLAGRTPDDVPAARRGRRAAVVAVVAAVLAGSALVALLVAGALRASPAANQAPAGPASSGSATPAGHATHGSTSQVSQSAGVPGSTPAASPAASSPAASASKSPSSRPSAKPSASPAVSTSPAASQSPSTSFSSPPSSSSPSVTSSGSPSDSPTTSSSPSTTAPPPSICLGVLCL